MRVMVLAAGRGERLMPLTRTRPKCLMPVMNRPLLGIWFRLLEPLKPELVVVNSHHLAERLRRWVRVNPPRFRLEISFEPLLMGTGGALVAAGQWLGAGPFLLVNADVLCAVELPALEEARARAGAVACLGLVDWEEVNTVAVGRGGRVVGFKGRGAVEAAQRWATYAGLAAISPRLLDFIPAGRPSSLVEALIKAMRAGEKVVGAWIRSRWWDMGTPERIIRAHDELFRSAPDGLKWLHPGGQVAGRLPAGVKVEGWAAVEPGVDVRPGAVLKRAVVLGGARVGPRAVVEEAVVGEGAVVEGRCRAGAWA